MLGDPPDYEPADDRSLAGMAAASGRTPLEVAYDAMLADDGQGLLYVPILNYAEGNLEPVREMLLHPRAVAAWPTAARTAASSATRRCRRSCSPTGPATAPAARRLPLEWVVKKQTHDTARLYGLGDRGTLEPGMVGDLNVIDYDRLQLGPPEVVADLPAGGTRLLQRAVGYVATIKSGVTTFADGEDTGARPGPSSAALADAVGTDLKFGPADR